MCELQLLLNNEMLILIKYSLAESVYTRQSFYIRYILKNIFKIELECSDSEIIKTVIDNKYLPKIFSTEGDENKKDENNKNIEKNENNLKSHTYEYSNKIPNNIDDILNFPLTVKKLGSLFINYSTSYPFDKETARNELMKLIKTNGYLLLYENFFLWYSGYIPNYFSTIDNLMNNEGMIPVTWRYYIAIMAVSSIRSYYMLKKLQEIFLLKGGDEEWLIYGLKKAPEKLKSISRINNILAHQPWSLKANDLKEILTNSTPANRWNRDEFVQAALIMINYHRLAAISESLKIDLAGDFNNFSMAEPDEMHAITDKEGKMKLYNYLMEMNQEYLAEKTQTTGKDNLKKRFSNEDVKINSEFENSFKSIYDNYTSNFCTLYLNFDFYSDSYLSNMTFNWDDHGSYILENIFPVESLNEEIKFIDNLTSHTVGGDYKKLNTYQLRWCFRCYLEKIFGIVNEDYDYSKTNKLLLISTKNFIKNIACLPQKIVKSDISTLHNTFSFEEIFHLIFLTSSNKARVQLTFLSFIIYDIIKSIE